MKNKSAICRAAAVSLLFVFLLSGCGRDVYVPWEDDTEDYSYEYTSADYSDDENEELSTEGLFDEHNTTGFVTTKDYELLNSGSPKTVTLYNNKYYGFFFGEEEITFDKIKQTIEQNKNISKQYKAYITDYAERMYQYYPDLEWRVFVYNIGTVEIVEKTGNDMEFMASGAAAIYNIDDNIIILNTDIDLSSDEAGKVNFRHELGHLFNNFRVEKDGYKAKSFYNVASEGQIAKEALNVIFTSEPFLNEYYEETRKNMGYSISTNMMRIILECIDYTVEDSTKSNIFYLEEKLDEVMADEMPASEFCILFDDYWEYCKQGVLSGEIPTEELEEYKAMFRYLAKLYIKERLNENSDQYEINRAEEELLRTLHLGIANRIFVYDDVIQEEFAAYAN